MIVNKFPAMAAALQPIVSQMVRKTAFAIAADAASNAAVDTGFMKSAVYVVTSQTSTYGNAGTPPGDSYLLPQVEAPGDDLTAIVACGANYSVFVELGHHTRGGGTVPAQPFFFPAVDRGAASFAVAAQAFERLLGAA